LLASFGTDIIRHMLPRPIREPMPVGPLFQALFQRPAKRLFQALFQRRSSRQVASTAGTPSTESSPADRPASDSAGMTSTSAEPLCAECGRKWQARARNPIKVRGGRARVRSAAPR
jgi:hypothetical protein